jgi:AraC-like DNA-binding protein
MDIAVNLRSLLLFLALVQGILIGSALLVRFISQKKIRHLFLGLLLIYLSFSLISYFIGFMGAYDYAREAGFDLTFFPFGNAYMYGPLLLLFGQSVARPDFKWRPEYWGHFALPAMYYALHFYFVVQPLPTKELIEASSYGLISQTAQYLSFSAYLALTFRELQLCKRQGQNSLEAALITPFFSKLVYVCTALFFISIGFDLASIYLSFSYTGWYWLVLIRAGVVYYLSAQGWAASGWTAETINWNQTPQVLQIQGKNLFEEAEHKQLQNRLDALMREQKPWLEPNLNLNELAVQMDLNSVQLSHLINKGFGQNFNDFVNAYRVEAVKESMMDSKKQHLSILGHAYECGFNSKATFNRAFKKLTGTAPSTFTPEFVIQ